MFKYLIGSINGSNNSRSIALADALPLRRGSLCRRVASLQKRKRKPCGSLRSTFLVPLPNFHSLPSLNTRSEYRVPNKASYTGFGTRLVVERVRHHSCGPSTSPQHSITEWACWNEIGRSGLSMMKAMARVVPTGVCRCKLRHSGATLRAHATKSVSPSVSAGPGPL